MPAVTTTLDFSPFDRISNFGERLARQLLDLSIILWLFVAPFALGGRHEVGAWIYSLIAIPGGVGLIVLHFQGQAPRLGWIRWTVLLLAVVLVVVQSCPLPKTWVVSLGSGYHALAMPVGDGDLPSSLGNTISLLPTETKACLPLAVAYVVCFLIFYVRFQTITSLNQILQWFVYSGVLLTVVILLQLQFGNGKFLWVYDHPTRNLGEVPRGPFQNENHLCNLLTMIAVVSLSFFVLGVHKTLKTSKPAAHSVLRPFEWVSGLSLALFAILIYATPSDGGTTLILVAPLHWGLLLFVSLLSRRLLSRASRAMITAFAWSIYVLCFATSVYAVYDAMPAYSPGRILIWSANWHLFNDFSLVGGGIGTHRFTYMPYLEAFHGTTFTHAESSFRQWMSEAGVLGIGLLTCCFMLLGASATKGWYAATTSHHRVLLAAMVSGLAASCFHCFFDFPWHIPACAVPILMLAAGITRFPEWSEYEPVASAPRLGADSREKRSRVMTLPRREANSWADAKQSGSTKKARAFSERFSCPRSWCLVCGLVFGLIYSVTNQLPRVKASLTWDQYARMRRDLGERTPETVELIQQILMLKRTLANDSNHISATSRLAQSTLLLASRVDNGSQRSKLLALGKHFAKKNHLLCPIDANAPLSLAEAFLAEGTPLSELEPLLQHALRLRPTDARPRTRLALLAYTQGDQQAADQYWQQALEKDPSQRSETIQLLLVFYSADEIVGRLQPSIDATELLLRIVRQNQTDDELRRVRKYLVKQYLQAVQVESSPQRAKRYLQTALRHAKDTKNPELILATLASYAERFPFRLSQRIEYIKQLMAFDRIADAQAELRQCQKLQPKSPQLAELAQALERAQFQRKLR